MCLPEEERKKFEEDEYAIYDEDLEEDVVTQDPEAFLQQSWEDQGIEINVSPTLFDEDLTFAINYSQVLEATNVAEVVEVVKELIDEKVAI